MGSEDALMTAAAVLAPIEDLVRHTRAEHSPHMFGTVGLKAIGTHAVERYATHSLGSLVPGLSACAGNADDRDLSARTRNRLRRSGCRSWESLARTTPEQLWKLPGIGARSLGEILVAAVDAVKDPRVRRVEPDSEAHRGALIGHAGAGSGGLQSGGFSEAQATPAVEAAIRTIVTWAIWERGQSALVPSLELALSAQDEVPSVVRTAVSVMSSASLRDWTAANSGPFDPLGAIDDDIAQLTPVQRTVAVDRVLADSGGRTLEELGRDLGVTRERIRQIETAVEKRLAEGADQRPVLKRTAARLRAYIGVASQLDALRNQDSPLRVLGLDHASLAGRYLLWLAGPYSLRGDWLVLSPAKAAIAETKQILAVATGNGPAALDRVLEALTVYGIPAREAREWIVSVSAYRIEGDVVIPWFGSMADKCVAILSLTGTPMTTEELLERICPNGNARSLANQLAASDQVKRTGLRHWGLRDWTQDEYTSVVDEIAKEIERCGGSATIAHLVDRITKTYGVAENTVRAYASSARFERDGHGAVTLATSVRRPTSSRPPHETRAIYRHRDAWVYRQRVTPDLLRGSGFPMSVPFAAAIGLGPLESLVLEGEAGRLAVSWSGLQPTFGSVRSFLDPLGAVDGDLCFISVTAGRVQVSLAPHLEVVAMSGLDRVGREIGLQGPAQLGDVAAAIGLDRDASEAAVVRRFQARGEAELAALLQGEEDDALVLSLDSGKYVEVKWSK